MSCVAIMHYATPPTVGGVEATIYYHARWLNQLGYTVRIVTGAGEVFDEAIAVYENPLFGSRNDEVLKLKKILDQGTVPSEFDELVARMLKALEEALRDCEICIVHNIPTFNKNLPLAVALEKYIQEHNIKLIAWCHDLAWTNPQYLPELYEKPPWTLLKQRWQGVIYVTVSEPRRRELADLLQISLEDVHVILPGVEPAEFYSWTPTTSMLAEKLNLLDADGLLLLPARLTRRKNVALALRILAALYEQTDADYRLIVTGPPGPHNPKNMGYLGELLDLRRELHIEDKAHFLYAYGNEGTPLIPDNATMANLYHIADALLFPSLQEGFGIPMLEAGFAGLPVFCADIPPLRATGQEDVYFFDPVNTPAKTIAEAIHKTFLESGRLRLRVRVRKYARWQRIVRDRVLPLLAKGK